MRKFNNERQVAFMIMYDGNEIQEKILHRP